LSTGHVHEVAIEVLQKTSRVPPKRDHQAREAWRVISGTPASALITGQPSFGVGIFDERCLV
jgi:hypothetical protein